MFFVSSRNARTPGMAGQGSYLASKHGMNAFADSVLADVSRYGVKTCCLNPGLVATDLGTRPHPNPAIRIASADEQIQLRDLTDALLFALRCDRAVPQHIDFETMVPSFRAASGGGEIKLSDQAKL